MAFLQVTYYSQALRMNVPVNVILPEPPKEAPETSDSKEISYRTLYLFHGNGGNHSVWMRRTAIERYAAEYGIAVVMPEVGRNWYTDTCYGANYFTFVTEELPSVCCHYFRGINHKRENNLVAGFSMGGYGALKAALTYPEKYCACASLSGALDITRKRPEIDMREWRGIFDFNMKDSKELEGSIHDIYMLARRNKEHGQVFPKLYLWCGTEDDLIGNNREFHGLLEKLQVEHCYEESEGDHSWKWWDMHIQDALHCLLDEKRETGDRGK